MAGPPEHFVVFGRKIPRTPLTTAYTLAAKKSGFNKVLSVGRVQTPVLGLLVKRKRDRDSFKPHPFYSVIATLEKGTEFQAKGRIESPESFCDSEGRLIEKSHAQDFLNSTRYRVLFGNGYCHSLGSPSLFTRRCEGKGVGASGCYPPGFARTWRFCLGQTEL